MLAFNDLCREYSSTAGTGTLTLTGAQLGYQTILAGIGEGNTCFYRIAEVTLVTTQYGVLAVPRGAYEIGVGTVSGATLSRDTVLESSNGDALVNLSGDLEVIVTDPSAAKRKIQNITASTSVSIQNNNTSFRNTGASELCIMDLPAAQDWMTFTFTITDGTYGFKLDAAGSETIRISGSVSSAGGTLQSTKQGASITIEGQTGVGWFATHALGTWLEA